MELSLLVALVVFLGFFIESIFGFGGTVISFAILGFVLDTKNMFFLGIYIGILASLFVILTDYKSFSKKILLYILPIALVGNILGVLLFKYLSDIILLKVFAIFLIIFALKQLFFNNLDIENFLFEKTMLFFGGLSQGLFGTGGPFTVMAIKNKFSNKSELRTTMAVFFILFNILRFIQLTIQGSFNDDYIIKYWWLVFVLISAIYLGHKVHLKINEKYFNLGINVLLLIASVILLLK